MSTARRTFGRGGAVALALALIASLVPVASVAAGTPSVVPATGGSAISADTATSGAYTSLSGPSLVATNPGSAIDGSPVVLSAPAGFVFDPASASAGLSGAGCGTLALGTIAGATGSITVPFTGASTADCTLTFGGVRVRPTSGYPLLTGSLTITGGGLSGVAAGTLTMVAGSPAGISISQQPSPTAGAGVAFATQPAATATDYYGNPIAGRSVTLVKWSGPSTGNLVCANNNTATTGANGVAAWSNCSLSAVGTYRLEAQLNGLRALTNEIVVSGGTPTKLVFTSYPASSTGTSLAPQPAVAITDAGGNVVPSASATITLSASGGGLSCTGGLSKATVNGVATFSGCIMTNGTWTLTASDGPNGYTDTTGSAFTVYGTGTLLQFSVSPAGATGGTAFTTQPVVRVLDASGNVVTSDNATVVALSIDTGTAGSTLTCSNDGTNGVRKTVSSGVATFSGCRIDKAGRYVLRATTVGTAISAVSAAFDVLVGPAVKLGFTSAPTGTVPALTAFAAQPVVAVQDAGGNTVTSVVSRPITIGIGSNPGAGTLTCSSGTTLYTLNGVASFSGCSINRAGVGYTLIAVNGGGGTLTGATSAAFNVSGTTTTLLLGASPSAVAYPGGVTSTLTATLVNNGGIVRTIEFQKAGPGELTWSSLGAIPSSTSGVASIAVAPTVTTRYRAVFAGNGDLAAATSSTATITVRHAVSMTDQGTLRVVRNGTRRTYVGTIVPVDAYGAQTATFYIYRKLRGVWVLKATTTRLVTRTGRVSYTRVWPKGEWYVRLRANATASYGTNTTPTARVIVR